MEIIFILRVACLQFPHLTYKNISAGQKKKKKRCVYSNPNFFTNYEAGRLYIAISSDKIPIILHVAGPDELIHEDFSFSWYMKPAIVQSPDDEYVLLRA